MNIICTLQPLTSTHVRVYNNEPQLPQLQTAIYMHLGVKNESRPVCGMPIPGFISYTGVTRSGHITCHVHITLMTGLKDVHNFNQ